MCYFGGLGDVKNLFADLSCACVVPSGYWIQYTYALHSPKGKKGKGRKETMAKIIHVAQSSVMVSVVSVSSPRATELKGKSTCSGVHIHPFGFASNAKASASATLKASSPRGVFCSNAQSDG